VRIRFENIRYVKWWLPNYSHFPHYESCHWLSRRVFRILVFCHRIISIRVFGRFVQLCKFLGSCSDVVESPFFWDVAPFSRIINCSWTIQPLKMRPLHILELSGSNHPGTWCHNPEKETSHTIVTNAFITWIFQMMRIQKNVIKNSLNVILQKHFICCLVWYVFFCIYNEET
jgi:hypothetical protein